MPPLAAPSFRAAPCVGPVLFSSHVSGPGWPSGSATPHRHVIKAASRRSGRWNLRWQDRLECVRIVSSFHCVSIFVNVLNMRTEMWSVLKKYQRWRTF